MKNYRKEFNYIIYYSDSTNEQDDLYFYTESFGQDKMNGIFKLTLGLHFPEILFLPEIENIHESWPPYVDYRLIQSAEDIYKALLLTQPYIVLPYNEWAGQVRVLEPDSKNQFLQIRKLIMVIKVPSFLLLKKNINSTDKKLKNK
jgi:hypothetical protein